MEVRARLKGVRSVSGWIETLRERYGQFLEWQRCPHQVTPMSDVEHFCPTCGTHYKGNYCPRCGQSAKIGRYSFKNAFLLFLDVWGLGNRGMFRTLRDLLLRPGYMIRDYLNGMQMAYFPPFKMFFLLVTFSLLVDSGLNIKGENNIKHTMFDVDRGIEEAKVEELDWNTPVDMEDADDDRNPTMVETDSIKGVRIECDNEEDEAQTKHVVYQTLSLLRKLVKWLRDHLTIVMLVGLLIVSWPLYLMFRHCPAIPDMRFSEFFVAMVYTSNMMNVYSILRSFLCLSTPIGTLVSLLAIVSLKQLTGYSYGRTILKTVAGLAIFSFIAVLLIALFVTLAVVTIVNGDVFQ